MHLPSILLAALSLSLADADATTRYGVAPDAKAYPQASAKEALASSLKAIAAKRFDYLLAHLVEPSFVDERVKRLYAGRFEEQVEDTRTKLDPLTVRQLTKFAEAGTWTEEVGRATVRLKDINDRSVSLKKIGDRWFLENQSKPASATK